MSLEQWVSYPLDLTLHVCINHNIFSEILCERTILNTAEQGWQESWPEQVNGVSQWKCLLISLITLIWTCTLLSLRSRLTWFAWARPVSNVCSPGQSKGQTCGAGHDEGVSATVCPVGWVCSPLFRRQKLEVSVWPLYKDTVLLLAEL